MAREKRGLLTVPSTVPAQLTRYPTLRMPVLESSIAANVRLRYERLVSCTVSAVQSERKVVHM
jgi:hypothetical protein